MFEVRGQGNVWSAQAMQVSLDSPPVPRLLGSAHHATACTAHQPPIWPEAKLANQGRAWLQPFWTFQPWSGGYPWCRCAGAAIALPLRCHAVVLPCWRQPAAVRPYHRAAMVAHLEKQKRAVGTAMRTALITGAWLGFGSCWHSMPGLCAVLASVALAVVSSA